VDEPFPKPWPGHLQLGWLHPPAVNPLTESKPAAKADNQNATATGMMKMHQHDSSEPKMFIPHHLPLTKKIIRRVPG
jgi:hypothetical protein